MGIRIYLSEEAYRIMQVAKKEGESFSDVGLRMFPRGHPARILTYLQTHEPIDEETAETMRKASREFRKNFKLRDVKL